MKNIFLQRPQTTDAQRCLTCGATAPERLGTWVSRKPTMDNAQWVCAPCLWLMFNIAGIKVPDTICARENAPEQM